MSHTTSTQLLRFDGGCSVEDLGPNILEKEQPYWKVSAIRVGI